MEKEKTESVIIGLCLILLIAFLLSLILGIRVTLDLKDDIKHLKIQAVDRGHAEWKVDNEGGVKWQWIKEKADG